MNWAHRRRFWFAPTSRRISDPCEGSWMYIFVQKQFSSEDVVVTVQIDTWKEEKKQDNLL